MKRFLAGALSAGALFLAACAGDRPEEHNRAAALVDAAPATSSSTRFSDPPPPPPPPEGSATDDNANRDPLASAWKGGPANVSGRYGAVTIGKIRACVNDQQVTVDGGAIVQLLVSQAEDDLARGILVIRGTGLPAIDGTQLPARFDERKMIVDTEVKGALPGLCSVPLHVSVRYDFGSSEAGSIGVEQLTSCATCLAGIAMTLYVAPPPDAEVWRGVQQAPGSDTAGLSGTPMAE